MVNAEELASEINQPTIICGELSAEERQVISRKWKKSPADQPCAIHSAAFKPGRDRLGSAGKTMMSMTRPPWLRSTCILMGAASLESN